MGIFCREKFQGLQFSGQRTETPDAGVFERHCHDRYELLYVRQGQGKFVVESAEYPLFPGMVLLMRPYEYHYVQPSETEPYDRIIVNFREEFLIPAVQSLSLLQRQPGEAGLCFSCPGATAALEQLPLCGSFPPEQKQAFVRATLEQLLLLLSLEKPAQAEHDPLMERVMRYLSEHLTEKISLDGLAREFFLSRSHLCRAFRSHTGVTLLDYITAKRVAIARQLLRQGLPAADCARQAGFAEYSTFYRAYCKHMGHSPAEERKSSVPG